MDIEKIGKFIKELRIEKELSQNQLSEKIHVTRQAVSNWENGKALPDSNILLLLSNLFNVSINEILSGKRLTKEDNLEEIALQLVDENNRKRNKIKMMMISFTSVLTVLVLLFLGYYFVTNYNSIKVYRVSGKSDKFRTREGILITTKKKSYLHLGEIEKLPKGKSSTISSIKVYCIDKNDRKIVLYKTDSTNMLIKDINSYNEYNLDQKTIHNNLYLEIKYDDSKTDTIQLILKEEFKNNFRWLKKKRKLNIVKDQSKQKDKEEIIKKVKDIKSKETDKLEINAELRKDENPESQNEKELVKEEQSNQPINNTQEESNNNQPDEQVETIPVSTETEENNEGEETTVQETIDYNEIINLIKEYGTEQQGIFSIEYMDDNTYYNIGIQNDTIFVMTSNGMVIESWAYVYKSDIFRYQKFINYVEEENINFIIDYNTLSENEISYIEKFNDIVEYIKSIGNH